MYRGVVRIHPAIIALFVVMFFGVWGQAQAGPITNGPGVAPFVKLGVYQGVISIVPGGLTDSIMEIGNAGRDIASTGALYLRPGTIGSQGGNVVITPQGGSDEGGELALQGAGSYQTWTVDIWRDRFRVHTNGQERLVFDGTAGNTYLPTGQLCFGNVGSTNCISGASGPGGTPTLDEVLAAGNSSARGVALGAAVTPASKLVINTGASSTGNINDGISIYANTPASAIYAQQNNASGYAGYFSGRVYANGSVEIRDPAVSVSFPSSALKVASNQAAPAPGGYTLSVMNTAATGYAAYFGGSIQVGGAGKYANSSGIAQGAVHAYSTTAGGTGIYGQGGAGGGSIGVFGQARSAAAGESTYGLYGGQAIGGAATGLCGDGSGGGNCYSVYGEASNGNGSARTYAIYGKGGLVAGGAQTYAGYFEGDVSITEDFFYKGRLKPTPGLQVCEVTTDTCLGRYLYTTGTARDTGASGIRYYYDTGSSVASVLVYYLQSSSPTCASCGANWAVVTRSTTAPAISYWSQASCAAPGAEYVYNGGTPYGSGQTCRDNTTNYTGTFYTYNGSCGGTVSRNDFRRINNNCLTAANSYGPAYELR